MLSLVNRIISETPIKTTYTDMGTSSRITYQLNILPLLNSSLFLFRSWEAFVRKDEEKQKLVDDIMVHIEWLRTELMGYRGVVGKEVLNIAEYRKVSDGFVKYDIGVLQLALNQSDSLEYLGKKNGLGRSQIYQILNSVYKKMLDKAIDIGKELDPKQEFGGDIDTFEQMYKVGEEEPSENDDNYFGFTNEISEG